MTPTYNNNTPLGSSSAEMPPVPPPSAQGRSSPSSSSILPMRRTSSMPGNTPSGNSSRRPSGATLMGGGGPSTPTPRRPSSPSSLSLRGRSRSPVLSPVAHSNFPPPNANSNSNATGSGSSMPQFRSPPSYARSSLDRSPSSHPLILESTPRVPVPIYLRSSSPQGRSNLGQLKIHVPAWGVCLVRPPRPLELHPLEEGSQAREPPTEDTVLSGSLEVIMKERRRCQAISVGVQSVCRLWMGKVRGWEEDGVFERGVEVLGGDADGIWLEKGSQTFTFTLLLPATLATHDNHEFARISYILTARVEGVGSSSVFGSYFKKESSISPDIPYKADFEAVIARSDKLAQEQATSLSSGLPVGSRGRRSRGSSFSRNRGSPTAFGRPLSPDSHNSPNYSPSPPTPEGFYGTSDPTQGSSSTGLGLHSSPPDDSVISVGNEGSPTLTGLYLRSQSSDIQRVTSAGADDRSVYSFRSTGSDSGQRSEKQGWLKGDLLASRSLVVHANPSTTGGVSQLDVRKEGFVDGIGAWRLAIVSDSFSIAAAVIISFSAPNPSPQCTIFFLRLLLVQTYSVISPRTPNQSPFVPEGAKNIVLYQAGRPHKHGERHPAYDVDSLWRGSQARGSSSTNIPTQPGQGNAQAGPSSQGQPLSNSNSRSSGQGGGGPGAEVEEEEGWRTRAVARLPNHDRMRPSTQDGTVTPIRVTHQFHLQVFYSLDGRDVSNERIDGPGELRMMTFKVPVLVPSCTCTCASLNLPTYESAGTSPPPDIDSILSSPPSDRRCMCGVPFAELGEAAMRRMAMQDQEELDQRMAATHIDENGAGSARGPGGSAKAGESRQSSQSSSTGPSSQ